MSGIGLALRESREIKHITQKTAASMGYCSYKLISAIERGERQISIDVLGRLTNEMDDPRLYMEAANEITGGVFGVPWLNGDCVDLHRSSVKEKVSEELQEALNAISKVRIYNNPNKITPEQLNSITESILEVIDVYIASAHYIAIMGREYGLSVKDLFEEQRQKLIKNGYLKTKEKTLCKGFIR